MKKILSLFLIVVLCVAAIACTPINTNQTPSTADGDTTPAPDASAAPDAQTTPDPDTTPAPVKTPAPTPTETEQFLASVTNVANENGVNTVTVKLIEAELVPVGEVDENGKPEDQKLVITELDQEPRTFPFVDQKDPFLFMSDPANSDIVAGAAQVDLDYFLKNCTTTPAFSADGAPQYFDFTVEDGKVASAMIWMSYYLDN